MGLPEFHHLDVAQAIDITGDEESARMVIETAIESLTDAMGRLDAAIVGRATHDGYAVLHALKGALPIYARSDLVSHVTDVEQTKHGDVPADIFERMRGVHAEISVLLGEVRTFVASPA